MYTKILFIALVSCALVGASPHVTSKANQANPSPPPSPSSAGSKVAQWWHNIEKKIDDWTSGALNKIKQFWDDVAKKESEKEKRYAEIRHQQEQTKEEGVKELKAKKSKWDAVLRTKEHKIAETRKKADDDIRNEINAWNDKFEKFMKDNYEFTKNI